VQPWQQEPQQQSSATTTAWAVLVGGDWRGGGVLQGVAAAVESQRTQHAAVLAGYCMFQGVLRGRGARAHDCMSIKVWAFTFKDSNSLTE
jgi:hypothetical protein